MKNIHSRLLLACLLASLISLQALSAQEQIVAYPSATKAVSQGNFSSGFDWLLDPTKLIQLKKNDLFFSLDGSNPFSSIIGQALGMRAGLSLDLKPMRLGFALNYNTTVNTNTEDEASNTTLSYTNFDPTTGRYATITETINLFSPPHDDSSHYIFAHAGLSLDQMLGFALQFRMDIRRYVQDSTISTNVYSNTAAVSPATLSSRGTTTATLINLGRGDEKLVFEPEVGLNLDTFSSRIALGVSFNNQPTADQTSTVTTSSFGGGLSPIALDQDVINAKTGAYYWDGTAVNTNLNMTVTTIPTTLQNTRLSLAAANALKLSETLKFEIPVAFGINLYPSDLASVDSTTTVGYNDSIATPRESSRSITTTSVSLSNATDLDVALSPTIRTAIINTDPAKAWIGAALGWAMSIDQFERGATLTTVTRVDNNNDGAYTSAGVDIDTTYTEDGYTIQNTTISNTFSLTIPFTVVITPTAGFNFMAGYSPRLTFTINDVNTLTEGVNTYAYETFADTLTSANSYARRLKNGTNNATIPDQRISTDLNFSGTGSFGFTLKIGEDLMLEALAAATNLSFSNFTLAANISF